MSASTGTDTGIVFDLKRFSSDDGPGIRTTVFLKGCPLKCVWCHSPESISPEPQLLFFESRCIRCGTCAAVCTRSAQHVSETERWVDRESCDDCGECAETCPTGALEMCGRRRSVIDLLDELSRDIPFYRTSGGGVTVSGGEPTAQPAFILTLLRECRDRGIHTVLDSNGFAGSSLFRGLVPLVDLFLFDLKHMDSSEHQRLTGVGNEPILRNLKRLAAEGARVRIRVPLIPGLNDSAENIAATSAYGRAIGVRDLDLLPYNAAAGSKYRWLGRDYPLERLKTQSEDYLASLVEAARSFGMQVSLGR